MTLSSLHRVWYNLHHADVAREHQFPTLQFLRKNSSRPLEVKKPPDGPDPATMHRKHTAESPILHKTSLVYQQISFGARPFRNLFEKTWQERRPHNEQEKDTTVYHWLRCKHNAQQWTGNTRQGLRPHGIPDPQPQAEAQVSFNSMGWWRLHPCLYSNV